MHLCICAYEQCIRGNEQRQKDGNKLLVGIVYVFRVCKGDESIKFCLCWLAKYPWAILWKQMFHEKKTTLPGILQDDQPCGSSTPSVSFVPPLIYWKVSGTSSNDCLLLLQSIHATWPNKCLSCHYGGRWNCLWGSPSTPIFSWHSVTEEKSQLRLSQLWWSSWGFHKTLYKLHYIFFETEAWMPPAATGRRLMFRLQFLPCQQHWPNMTAGLCFMVGSVKQGHLQYYLLNTWAHLAGSLSTGKLKEVLIIFLNETPPAARTHLLLSENIFWDRNYSCMVSSKEPRSQDCLCVPVNYLFSSAK